MCPKGLLSSRGAQCFRKVVYLLLGRTEDVYVQLAQVALHDAAIQPLTVATYSLLRTISYGAVCLWQIKPKTCRTALRERWFAQGTSHLQHEAMS